MHLIAAFLAVGKWIASLKRHDIRFDEFFEVGPHKIFNKDEMAQTKIPPRGGGKFFNP
jgi:hypothetical protein